MKRIRQEKMLELISKYEIDTQDEQIGRASCRERVFV